MLEELVRNDFSLEFDIDFRADWVERFLGGVGRRLLELYVRDMLKRPYLLSLIEVCHSRRALLFFWLINDGA